MARKSTPAPAATKPTPARRASEKVEPPVDEQYVVTVSYLLRAEGRATTSKAGVLQRGMLREMKANKDYASPYVLVAPLPNPATKSTD